MLLKYLTVTVLIQVSVFIMILTGCLWTFPWKSPFCKQIEKFIILLLKNRTKKHQLYRTENYERFTVKWKCQSNFFFHQIDLKIWKFVRKIIVLVIGPFRAWEKFKDILSKLFWIHFRWSEKVLLHYWSIQLYLNCQAWK